MDTIIQFMNNKRESIVTFSDFILIEDTNYINYNIKVSYKSFTATVTSQSEIYDFEYLILGLNKLYCQSIDSFEFCDIEKHLIINIQYTETGQILLHINIRNIDYSIKLDINFTSDQTFIPALIQEIKTIVDLNNKNE